MHLYITATAMVRRALNAFIDWLIGNEKPTLIYIAFLGVVGETILLTEIF
jgi:hypothetical protein